MNKHQIGDLVWLHGGGWSNIPLIVMGHVDKHVGFLAHDKSPYRFRIYVAHKTRTMMSHHHPIKKFRKVGDLVKTTTDVIYDPLKLNDLMGIVIEDGRQTAKVRWINPSHTSP